MSDVSISVICDFLIFMFDKRYSCSTLNSIISAFSFFCDKSLNVGDNVYINRLFKSFYKERPLRAKHFTFWPVHHVLDLLANWHPANTLDLKHLTLKTVALIALSSSDRGQTLHAMNIENTDIKDDAINFIIYSRLKTSKLNSSAAKIVKCISCEKPELNVCDYVLNYLTRTFTIRASAVAKGKPKPTNLFLSWKTKQAVTKQTIARWLKMVLSLAEIDTSQFTAHSFRGAGLSHAFEKGATVNQILEAGDWTSVKTFNNYYNKPTSSSDVGKLILNCNQVVCS